MKAIYEHDFHPSAYDMSEELWEWDASKQAQFINSFLIYNDGGRGEMVLQLAAIAEELRDDYRRNLDQIIWLLENFVDELKKLKAE